MSSEQNQQSFDGAGIKTYTFEDGRKYDQRMLVGGQLKMILGELSDVIGLFTQGMSELDMLCGLGDRAIEICGIVLLPHGKRAHEIRDWKEHRRLVTWTIDPGMAAEVVRDFLSVNPVSLWFETWSLAGKEAAKLMPAAPETALTEPSPRPLEETAQSTGE